MKAGHASQSETEPGTRLVQNTYLCPSSQSNIFALVNSLAHIRSHGIFLASLHELSHILEYFNDQLFKHDAFATRSGFDVCYGC